MRVAFTACLALAVAGVSTGSQAGQRAPLDWDQWRHLPVQDGGRFKPLDTLARETLRRLANRASFPDPETAQKLDADTFYLTILFDWQGWDQPGISHASSGTPWRGYYQVHKPDKWDRAPLLRVDWLALREALKMPKGRKYISPLALCRAKIRLPNSPEERPFLRWVEERIGKHPRSLTLFDKKALELADKFWSYQDHRMGRRLQIVPAEGSKDRPWMDVAQLVGSDFDDRSDPTGLLRRARQQFRLARAAYLAGSATDFNIASASFLAAVTEVGPQQGPYPSRRVIDLEVYYNHGTPFRLAWIFTLMALLCFLLHMATHWKPFCVGGWIAFTGGLAAMCVGFALRVAIAGRAPVTNMYESVVYLGLGVAVLGIVFEMIYRNTYILTAASAVATIALILADNVPAALDPSLRPLEPVLRSNFWLVTHVMTIMLSYAAFALALGIGDITLGYFLAGSPNRATIDSLNRFTYRAIQTGVLLLAAGTILGGVWADYSWGRFWGWDPKEVWALIALLGYLAVLHARYAGWVKSFGLAALAVLCFSLVVMAWYGVNFVLGCGLHSYGFGGGGRGWVLAAIVLQILYVAAAAIRGTGGAHSPVPEQAHGA